MKLPTTKQAWVIKNRWILEAISVLPTILGSAVGGLKVKAELDAANERLLGSDGGSLDKSGIWWILGGAVLSIGIAVWRAAVARAEGSRVSQKESPMDLYGCCLMLRAMLIGNDPGDTRDCLRITIHRVSSRRNGSPETLEQLIEYACADGQAGGEIGRTLSAHCGIIGRVARTGEAIAGVRANGEANGFRAEMVQDWGFTDEQARQLDDSRWAWMGVPLLDEKRRVAGVVFFDSCDPEYFTDERKSRILSGCEAVNRFARERYS